MTNAKWPLVLANKRAYPDADHATLAKLSDCEIRCVASALQRPEAAEFSKTPEEILSGVKDLDPTNVDAVDLLFKNLIKLNSVTMPSVDAVRALITFLDKTGQLVPKGVEEEWQQRIEKLTVDGLVEVSTKKSPSEDAKESLYQ